MKKFSQVKKDYLNENDLADTADLILLGAFYGTGSKGTLYFQFIQVNFFSEYLLF